MKDRVLVVDDEPNLLRALSACLESEGYDVTTARSAAEALTRLAQGVPDLIISDIRMPGTDGFGLLRQVRASSRTSLVPIVFLTAKHERADRIAGFQGGVDAYLTKPFEPDELLAIITSILGRVRRTHAEIARLVATRTDGPGMTTCDDLTEAERRIAAAVARGRSNRDIATEQGISVRTVENHISHILAKKGFGNRVEIARYVLERATSMESPLNPKSPTS